MIPLLFLVTFLYCGLYIFIRDKTNSLRIVSQGSPNFVDGQYPWIDSMVYIRE